MLADKASRVPDLAPRRKQFFHPPPLEIETAIRIGIETSATPPLAEQQNTKNTEARSHPYSHTTSGSPAQSSAKHPFPSSQLLRKAPSHPLLSPGSPLPAARHHTPQGIRVAPPHTRAYCAHCCHAHEMPRLL